MDAFPNVIRATHDHLSPANPYDILVQEMPQASPRYGGDMHYALQFGIVMAGRIHMRYRDFEREFRSGQVWWSSCWEPHASRTCDAPAAQIVVNVRMEELCAVRALDGFSWLTPFMVRPHLRPYGEQESTRQTVLRIGATLREVATRPRFGARTLGWLKLHELILTLTAETRPSAADEFSRSHEDYLRILPAVELLRQRVSEPVAVETAATACGLGRSRFCQLFRNVMNCGFHQFTLKARTAAAAQDLRSTRLPVKAVAERWGFFDQSHFHHLFRRFFHCTPGEYRLR
jgi:AraC-like DNA-binding protein